MKARYLLLALVAWGCSDPAAPPTPSVPAPNADLLGDEWFGWPPPPPPVGLLTCTPLAADTESVTIGPDGGTLFVGPHRLTVPAGALDTAVTITAVMPSDTVNRVHFEPEGLQFHEPARLRMSYANCDLLGSLAPKRIAYTSDALEILEYLLSFDNFFAQRVSADLNHFSDYAIAW